VKQMMEDKRIRYLAVALLAVVLVLGLFSLVSTALQLIVPLAIASAAAFAFYKIVLEGRDSPAVMEDEIAEAAGVARAESIGETLDTDRDGGDAGAEARQRLSAVERARSELVDKSTPAEEILDQIRSRKQRLSGDDA